MYRLNNKQQEPKGASAGQIKNRNPQTNNQTYQGLSYLSKYQAVQYNDFANYAQTPPSHLKPSPLQNYKNNLSSNKQYIATQQKRPYQPDLLNKSMEGRAKSQENDFERSPVQKSKESKIQNPVFRSANYPNIKTDTSTSISEKIQTQPVSTSQQFKPSKQQDSLSDIPFLTKESVLPYYEPTKCSSGRNGIIKAYAANTNQGIVRDYNEDRVSIILNIVKPQTRQNENWPKCSFFGVYDGHGGAACADFLRDNLHQFVIREPEFPWNPTEALKRGFEAAENHFIELALQSYQKGVPERSGSCAIVALIVGDQCYIANVGDSRAVMSACGGRQIGALSRDHKPCDELEQQRIQKGGGKIYQTQTHANQNEYGGQESVIVGPLRVLPGRLSVSRTFGDIEAKLERFGGNPNVVVAEPEIKCFKIQDEHDFIVLASDGIFDKMSSNEVMNTIWDDLKNPGCQATQGQQMNLHSLISGAVEAVLKESINKRTYDNITVVIIAFSTKQEEETRVQTNQSIERQQSVTPPIPEYYNAPYMATVREEMEKRTFLSKNYPGPSLRSSCDSVHENHSSNNSNTLGTNQNYQWTYLKPKSGKAVFQRYQNENQENIPYSQNVTQRSSQGPMKQSFYPIQQQQQSFQLDLKKPTQTAQPKVKRPQGSGGLDDVTNRYNIKGSFIF